MSRKVWNGDGQVALVFGLFFSSWPYNVPPLRFKAAALTSPAKKVGSDITLTSINRCT